MNNPDKEGLINNSADEEHLNLVSHSKVDHVHNSKMASFDSINLSEVIEVEPPSVHHGNNRVLGITYILISSVFYSIMTVLCKIVYTYHPNTNGLDYLLIRGTSLTFFAIADIYRLDVNILDIKKGYKRFLVIRCVCGGLGMPAFFFGLKYIPASKATLIMNTHPLLVAVLAYFLLKEVLSGLSILALIGAFVGITLFSFHENDEATTSEHYFLGIFLAAFTCVCLTLICIVQRELNKEVHYALSPFYFAMVTFGEAVLLLCVQLATGIKMYNFEYYNYSVVLMFFISGIFNYIAQVTRSIAYKYEEASFLTTFSYLQVILLLFSDLMLFGYEFTSLDILGVILTTCCILAPTIRDFYASHSKTESNS